MEQNPTVNFVLKRVRQTFEDPSNGKTHQSFLLTEGVRSFQVGVAVHGVGVHAVLEGLHFLNHFLQLRVFDAHVVDGVEQRQAIWETFLHLLQTKCFEGKRVKRGFPSSSTGSQFLSVSPRLPFVPE